MKTFVLDWDDYSAASVGFEHILKLKDHYPNLKVTLFTIVLPEVVLNGTVTTNEFRKWADYVREQDWIEICPHGFVHYPAEMLYKPNTKVEVDYQLANETIDAVEKTFEKDLNLPYKKIWKSPYWQTSREAYRALVDRGYTIALDPNQPTPEGLGKTYFYNWSMEQPIPDIDLVKGHGHMYPPSSNAIQDCLPNLLKMPTDIEFKFISEVL